MLISLNLQRILLPNVTNSKELQDLGHKVIIVVTDEDGFYFDKANSENHSAIRKKLLDVKGKTMEINEVPVYPIHCTKPRFGMYCSSAKNSERNQYSKISNYRRFSTNYNLKLLISSFTC